MTRRPFPDIDSPRVLPDRRRPDPWPFIALIVCTGVIVWAIVRAFPATSSNDGATVSQVVAPIGDDGPLLTVVAWLVMTSVPAPTQTPDVRIVTATPTETPVPEQLPICEQAALGEVCLRTAGLVTATPTAGAPWCSELTPSSYGYPQRCKNSAVSTARDEVK